MYRFRQFHHRQNKGEERGGESWQKTAAVYQNMERRRCKKTAAAGQTSE
jgi:hypothetical protein